MLMTYEPSHRDNLIAVVKNTLQPTDGLVRRVRDWLALRGDIYLMQGLDDHLLADMGLPHDEIETRVKGRRLDRADSLAGSVPRLAA